MLTGKQKRYLRSLAVNEKSILQIGKDGLNPNLYTSIEEAIKARELIKISVLKTCEESIDNIVETIEKNTTCDIVQIIGKTIVLYKPAKERKIILP